MRHALAVTLLSLSAAGCDDKPSGSGKPAPSAPMPSTSVAVVNAKLGCVPAKDGGNPIATTSPPGELTLAAFRGKATLSSHVRADGGVTSQHVTLDGEGRPEGAMQPGPDTPPPERPTVSVSLSPVEATVRANGKTNTWRVDPPRAGETIEVPAAAAVGATWAALALRVTHDGESELRVERIPYDDGKDAGAGAAKKEPPAVIAKGPALGTPALAFEGDVVHVIWPERAGEGAPWRLRWRKWTGKGAPSEPQYLSTRGGSATEPALAIQPNGLYLVAWTDGEPGKAEVKAGSSRISLLHAVTNADGISGSPGKAHGPAVAVEGLKTWVAWKDDAALRSTTLRCIE